MASLRERNGKWLAEVHTLGRRAYKSHPTREAAERWAARTERSIRMRDAQARDTLTSVLPVRYLEALRIAEYSADEIIGGAIPAHASVGVYFLMLMGSIVYVGQTTDLLGRLARHRRLGREFDSYNFIPVERARLDEVESAYIAALMPRLNSKF